MSNPVQGKQYTIVKDDTLSDIAATVYGDGTKWPIIYKANETALKSGNPDLIYPGEKITIPFDTVEQKLRNENLKKNITAQTRDEIKLIINDIEIPTQELTLTRTMDTGADGFTASIAWIPKVDPKLDEATKPYGYQPVQIYIGGILKFNGSLYKPQPSTTISGRSKSLEGWSLTIDAVDSTFKPPYEVSNYNLKQRAIELFQPMGLSVDWRIDDNLKFDKITASSGDKVFSHLAKYAKQRGVLISCTETGDPVFWKADTNGKSIGTIKEGKQQGFLDYKAAFDGRERFNSYKAIGQSPGSKNKFEIVKDDKVPKSRTLTFNNPDTTKGDLKSAAEWKRSSQLGEALSIPFNAVGFYAPDGSLWDVNKKITVISDTISIDEGFDFLITRVVFGNGGGGKTAQLNLVPPQVFTGEPIPDIFL